MSVFEALGTVYGNCCATCSYWSQDSVKPQAGQCNFSLDSGQHRNLPTLDLAVCSKWQDKEEAECFDISRELSEQDQKQLRENIEQNNALLRHLKKPVKEASE